MSRRRPRRPGRPTLLTPETVEQLLVVVRLGVPTSLAAGYVGVGASTLRRWLAIGRDERDRVEDGEAADPALAAHLDLVVAVDRARAEFVLRAVAQIQAAARDGRWQAAAWMLERREPEEFGRWRTTRPTFDPKPSTQACDVDTAAVAASVRQKIAAMQATLAAEDQKL
ncbi:hypothetical protein [Embleya sp. NPDC059237]|uniref:hypothetical protein n=1 Tax=Embleya sp. NPDC059237 TaxID=3346784 RepID=UPI003676636D